MLTKQFNQVVKSAITGESFLLKTCMGNTYSVAVYDNMSNGYQTLFTQNMMRIPYLMARNRWSSALSESAYGGVAFGTGTTEPTENDHAITIKVLSSDVASVSAKVEQSGSTCIGTYSIVNNGDDPITITEVGLFGMCPKGDKTAYNYLIDRTLLEEPLVIPVGGMGKVIYTINVL